MTANLVASVQARLLNHARSSRIDPNLVLTRYATERLLYRMCRADFGERFILKGALLLLVWFGEVLRPTRDADLLGFGNLEGDALRKLFRTLCELDVEPDGLTFDPLSIEVVRIRNEDAYGGQRVTLLAHLGTARIKVQVDIGIGDAVVPEADWIDYPSLLNMPRPRMRAYRPETAIAEKLHAMVELGTRNSRMRDYFDIHALSEREAFRGEVLQQAIEATFSRRRTPVPTTLPVGLTQAFATSEGKASQWRGFQQRLLREDPMTDLPTVVARLADFAGPALIAAGLGQPFSKQWPPGGSWT